MPRFPNTIAVPKSSLISPCFPNQLFPISVTVCAAPSFYIIFRFPQVCLSVSVFFFSPCPDSWVRRQHIGWLAESNRSGDLLPCAHGCPVRQCRVAHLKAELSSLSCFQPSVCSPCYPAGVFCLTSRTWTGPQAFGSIGLVKRKLPWGTAGWKD